MTTPQAPVILLIDDEPDLQRGALRSVDVIDHDLAACFKVYGPDEVTEAHLRSAHLVLVDYKLDKWEDNAPEAQLCKHVPNGLALIAIFQQRLMAMKGSHAVAFAIHSGHLPELTDPFSFEPRIHMLSRACNIDWAFEKEAKSGLQDTLQKVRCLAEAVQRLPSSWPQSDPDKTREDAEQLLNLDRAKRWADQAWSDVERAHPPLDELIHRVHGLLFVRWMLHRIMSYPCFLLDEHWLAARLTVTPASVREALTQGLGKLIQDAEYHGILAGINGPRWWRIGVEYALWQLGNGKSLGVEELRRLLIHELKLPLKPTESLQPVVCLDTDFQPLDQLYDSNEAVRILPDDWPPYAEQGWATIELALGNKRTNGLVIEADRPRLENIVGNGEA